MKKYLVALVAILLLISSQLFAEKVLIFTYSYNRPDFIEIQHKTFKKFLKDDYEFVVFNDAADEKMFAQIENTCENLGIRCIPIPQIIHTLPYLPRMVEDQDRLNHPIIRNCNVVQYSLNTLGFFHDGIVALFDSGLFLVRDFSIKEFMEGYHLAGLDQCRIKDNKERIDYLWIGIVFLDMSKLPNKQLIGFNTCKVDEVSLDAGGFTHYYLRNNPDINLRHFAYAIGPYSLCQNCIQADNAFCTHNTAELRTRGFDENQIKFIQSGPLNSEFFENGIFVHYRAGTNWDWKSNEYHRQKTKMFNEYFKNILEE